MWRASPNASWASDAEPTSPPCWMRSGPAHGLVRAKTGTTANSSALSGFVGARYVFSVLENGSPVRTLSAQDSQNRFAQVLAHAAAG